ncbi:27269_t:CDS:2, partial [Racocetra persica]
MSTITLSCLVVGENPYENAFAAEINEATKEKNTQDFANVDAKDIKLWKIDISFEEENKKLELVNTKINVNIKEDLGGEELPSLSKISKRFPSQPAEEHIHIIVQRPVETKEVHCTATYGRKSANFQWTVSREMVSLEGFKKKLCEYFTFPDGTENEHIVIGRIVADEDLLSIIWTVNPKVDLEIVVDASQQPFSSYTFPKMKVLCGLKADSYGHLPCIEIGSSATPEEIRNSVIEDFLRMHKASPPITSANEATPFKREDINQGIAQSTVQAHASMQCNRKKHTCDDADLYEGAMYCIVSTGVDWVITKVQSGIGDENDNGDGNLVEKLFKQIKWVFDQQKSSLVGGKR